MKKLLSILIAVVMLFAVVAVIAACADETYEIAVVTDVGQLMDGSFNQGTWEGAESYAKANNKTYKYYQPQGGSDATDNDRIAAMELAVKNGAKVIVAPGFLQATAMTATAIKYPEVKFVFIDGWSLTDKEDKVLDNVTAVVYKEQESGYFAGYAAVMEGYTKLGYTGGGGGANPACNRFGYGFIQGAEAAAIEKGVDVSVKFSFKYGDNFSASTDLQTQISGWYSTGTEVVFSCGGSMFESVKSAAEANPGKKIIGVDVDQSHLSDAVITSAVKGLKESVSLVLSQIYDGKWESELAGKTQNLGAAENATGLPTATWKMTNFTVAQYNELFAKVKNGTVVPSADIPNGVNQAWFDALDLTKVTVSYEA